MALIINRINLYYDRGWGRDHYPQLHQILFGKLDQAKIVTIILLAGLPESI